MSDPKQLENVPSKPSGTISQNASDWIQQFIKYFELEFLQLSSNLSVDSDRSDFQLTTMRAILSTLIDSGMDHDSLLEMFTRVLSEHSLKVEEWSDEMNARRFALIDKDIQKGLNFEEQIEFARLTNLMRQQVDTESNLPMDGARALHKKLTGTDSSE